MARPRKARYAKPRPSFPLTPYKDGWCKKIGGRVVHVCGHLPPAEAERVWEKRATELREKYETSDYSPPPGSDVTLAEIVGQWLSYQRGRAHAGDLNPASYARCRRAAEILIRAIDKRTEVSTLRPDHFMRVRAAVDAGGTGKANRLQLLVTIKGCFSLAADEDWIDRPVKFGNRFLADLRTPVGAPAGKRFAREECRAMLRTAGRLVAASETALARRARYRSALGRSLGSNIQVRAMLWLALNGGYHGSELAELRRDSIDRRHHRIDQHRGKTEAPHRVPLWPETRLALRVALDLRPDDELVFRTGLGNKWVRDKTYWNPDGSMAQTYRHNALAMAFSRLCEAAGVSRAGRGFHGLRHTHRSVSGGAGDESAADVLVGHRLKGMRAVYQEVDWKRLVRVSDHVRQWLRSDLGKG